MKQQTYNNALEQAATVARPWQAAAGKPVGRAGPRSGHWPPLLIAGVSRFPRTKPPVLAILIVLTATLLLTRVGPASPIFGLPLDPVGSKRAQASTDLRVTFVDSTSEVLVISRSREFWSLDNGRLALRLPFQVDSLLSVRRVVGRTGDERTAGAIYGVTLGAAGGYLFASSRYESRDGGDFGGYGLAKLQGAVVGAIGGAVLGSLIGRSCPRYEIIYE